MRSMSALLLAFALVGAGPGFAVAEMHEGGQPSLEQLVVEMADTPEEHRALARHYRGKAEHMRKMAAEHRSMAAAYTGGKMVQRERMREHCGDLASAFEKAAADYEALAEEHQQAAE